MNPALSCIFSHPLLDHFSHRVFASVMIRLLALKAVGRIAALALVTLLAAQLGRPAAAAAQQPVGRDTVVTREDSVPEVPARSPLGAFVRSLVLPGWGQAWVGAPGRGAIYFALESGSLWMVYRTRQKLSEARTEQELLREVGILGPQQDSPLVEAREQQFEDWLTLSVFLLFFSGADAFVSAYLADFDERVRVAPTAGGALEVGVHLSVGGGR